MKELLTDDIEYMIEYAYQVMYMPDSAARCYDDAMDQLDKIKEYIKVSKNNEQQ